MRGRGGFSRYQARSLRLRRRHPCLRTPGAWRALNLPMSLPGSMSHQAALQGSRLRRFWQGRWRLLAGIFADAACCSWTPAQGGSPSRPSRRPSFHLPRRSMPRLSTGSWTIQERRLSSHRQAISRRSGRRTPITSSTPQPSFGASGGSGNAWVGDERLKPRARALLRGPSSRWSPSRGCSSGGCSRC